MVTPAKSRCSLPALPACKDFRATMAIPARRRIMWLWKWPGTCWAQTGCRIMSLASITAGLREYYSDVCRTRGINRYPYADADAGTYRRPCQPGIQEHLFLQKMAGTVAVYQPVRHPSHAA